jgi:hypothetical protein
MSRLVAFGTQETQRLPVPGPMSVRTPQTGQLALLTRGADWTAGEQPAAGPASIVGDATIRRAASMMKPSGIRFYRARLAPSTDRPPPEHPD